MPDHILIIKILFYSCKSIEQKIFSLLTEFSLLKMESINWSGQLCCLQSCCCCKNVHLELCAHWARLTYIVQVYLAGSKHFPRSSSSSPSFAKRRPCSRYSRHSSHTFLNWKEGFESSDPHFLHKNTSQSCRDLDLLYGNSTPPPKLRSRDFKDENCFGSELVAAQPDTLTQLVLT